MNHIVKAILALALPLTLLSQVKDSSPRTYATFTVTTLPTASSWSGGIVTVTDSLTDGSCTSGGGTFASLCRSNGSSWVSIGGSGGGGSVSAGTGINVVGSTVSIDQTVTQTRATLQAGTSSYCRSTTGNDTYICSLTPALTAYTTGGCVILNADTANTGVATLSVDGLGSKSILTRSGGALANGDITANKPINLCYDGTQYVIAGDGGVTAAGTGLTISGVTVSPDTAVLQTRATLQAGTSNYCRSSTGNDTYLCSLTPALTAYTTGGCLVFNGDTSNTGAATINVDSVGVKSILNRAGSALADGDITANKPTTICYDGTQFIIQGDGGATAVGTGLTISGVTISPDTAVLQTRATLQAGTSTYCRSTTGNATYTCSITPALTTYTTGGCLVLNADFANVTTATVNVNSLGAKSILSRTGGALSAGDIAANKPITVCYDGTQYIIQGDGAGGAVSAGTGILVSGSTVSADTAVMQSRATQQAGTSNYCRSTTGNTTYTCTLTPTLTAYSTGGCLVLNADTANTTTATINVDTLGAKSILNRAGSALVAGDITANKPISVCYDGTQFIIQGDGGGSTITYSRPWAPFDNIYYNKNSTFGYVALRNYIWRFYTPAAGVTVRAFGIGVFPWTQATDTLVITLYDSGGTTKIDSCNTNTTAINPSGSYSICKLSATQTLTANTEYILAITSQDTDPASYCSGSDITSEWNTLAAANSALWPGGRIQIGYGSNVATGTGATLASPSTVGTVTSANQCIPMIAFYATAP